MAECWCKNGMAFGHEGPHRVTDDAKVRKEVADEVRDWVTEHTSILSYTTRCYLLQLMSRLDPPPPNEPEIWADGNDRYLHIGAAEAGPGFMLMRPLAPPWLGPERERVSVTKKAETDRLLASVRRLVISTDGGEIPSQRALQYLREDCYAFDAAHRPRKASDGK